MIRCDILQTVFTERNGKDFAMNDMSDINKLLLFQITLPLVLDVTYLFALQFEANPLFATTIVATTIAIFTLAIAIIALVWWEPKTIAMLFASISFVAMSVVFAILFVVIMTSTASVSAFISMFLAVLFAMLAALFAHTELHSKSGLLPLTIYNILWIGVIRLTAHLAVIVTISTMLILFVMLVAAVLLPLLLFMYENRPQEEHADVEPWDG